MTVSELIQLLKEQDEDATVHFVYNYGDHWRTNVAPVVRTVEEGCVVHSDYHRMPKVIDVDDDRESHVDIKKATKAVLIHG